jgi:hypothetical protein
VAAVVVGDEDQVLVVPAVADLIDADLHEPTLLKRSIPSADSAANDVADGWPLDVHHAADDFWLACWAK